MPGVSPSARLPAASDNGQYLRVVSVLADELTLAGGMRLEHIQAESKSAALTY